MNHPIFFDLETSPLPLEQIQHLKPEFRAPANYKDLDKIKASIMEQEAKWLADGALSALTGRVICFGYMANGEFYSVFGDEHEKLTVQDSLGFMAQSIQAGHVLVGFCCRTFDTPFLIRRAWAFGVSVPACLFEGRYLSSSIVDVADRFACGGKEPRDRISLDTLSKFLGTGQKNGDGAEFAKLWASDRPKALDYLKNDLTLTKLAYERLYACP